MNFTVEYRDAHGRKISEVIAAENRGDVFAKMKTRGITPISVAEGGSLNSRASDSPSSRGLVKGVIAGLLVIGLAVAAWFLLQPADKPEPPKAPPLPPRVRPAAVVPASNRVAKTTTIKSPKPATEDREARRARLRAMTPDQRWEYVAELAKNRPLPAEPHSNRVFRTSLEQTMDWVFTAQMGNPPPLLPKMSLYDELHLTEILISDDRIKDTDSDKVKESKEMMKLAKKTFRDFIRQGGDPYDFLPYYHGQLVQAHEEWKDVRKQAMEIVKTDPDLTSDFLRKANEKLMAKGIKKVVLPPKFLEKHGVQIDE